MKHFKAAAQRATAFVLAASMMSSAVLPTVFAAQPLNAENSVDELGNVDAADEDGTLGYPEWDDDTAADLSGDVAPELMPGDGGEIATYSATYSKWSDIADTIKKTISSVTDTVKKIDRAVNDFKSAYEAFKSGNLEGMTTSELEAAISAYDKAQDATEGVQDVIDSANELLKKYEDYKNTWPVSTVWNKLNDGVSSLQDKLNNLQSQLNEVEPQYEAAKAELENRKNAEVAAEAAKKAVDAVETAYAALASDENLTLDSFKDIDRQITLAKDAVKAVQDDELKKSLECCRTESCSTERQNCIQRSRAFRYRSRRCPEEDSGKSGERRRI